MTDKIMSFEEWFKSEPNLETREKSSARIAWDACNEMHEYQYNKEIDSLKSQLKEKDEQINLFHTHTALKVKEYVESKNYYDLPEKFHEEIDDFLNWYKKERDDQIKEMRLELKQKDAEIKKKDSLLKESTFLLSNLIEDIYHPSSLGLSKEPNPNWITLNEAKDFLKKME